MTSWVTVASARPRKPLRSPGRIQRGALGPPDVGCPPSGGDQLARGAPGPFGQGRAPCEAPAVVGDIAELELDGRPEVPEKAQACAVRLSFTLVLGVQHDLEARIDALGVSGQKIPQPASNFRVGPPREHRGILAKLVRAAGRRGAGAPPAEVRF